MANGRLAVLRQPRRPSDIALCSGLGACCRVCVHETYECRHSARATGAGMGEEERACTTSAPEEIPSTLSVCCIDADPRPPSSFLRDACNLNEIPTVCLQYAPAWCAKNPYILSGHRPQLSFRACMRSYLTLHNESGSLFLQTLGCITFTVAALSTPLHDPLASLYYVSVIVGYLSSVSCHLFAPVSAESKSRTDRIDWTATWIGAMMTGLVSSRAYQQRYTKYEPRFSLLGVTLVVVASTSISIFWLWSDFAVLKTIRALSMFAMLFLGWLPQVMAGFWSSLFCFAVGGLCFVLKLPERFSPGRFDMLGSGHQILHLLSLFGHLLALRAIDGMSTIAPML